MSPKTRRKRQIKATKAIAYLRTSSAANVGQDKDSEKRQRDAIQGFADRAEFKIVDWLYDPAVSGADEIQNRPGFGAVLDRIDANGIRVVLVEDASRFARDMKAHVLGLTLLRERDVKLFSASAGTDLTDDTDEMTEAMISVAAVFAQLEKKRLVKKLRAARDRKSAESGKRIEGRKPPTETKPETVTLAKKLRRANPKTRERRSYRQISKVLAQLDPPHLSEAGAPYPAMSIKRMIEGPKP